MKVTYSFKNNIKPSTPLVEKIDRLEEEIGDLPQIELKTTHSLSGGMYARTLHIPAGTALVGVTHRKDHLNIMHGDITVTLEGGSVKRLTGYHVIETKAGAKRAGFAHADTLWTSVCATPFTDIEEIENDCVVEVHKLQSRKLALVAKQAEKLEK